MDLTEAINKIEHPELYIEKVVVKVKNSEDDSENMSSKKSHKTKSKKSEKKKKSKKKSEKGDISEQSIKSMIENGEIDESQVQSGKKMQDPSQNEMDHNVIEEKKNSNKNI